MCWFRRGLNSPALAYSSEDEFGFGEASMSSGSDSMVVPQMNQVRVGRG